MATKSDIQAARNRVGALEQARFRRDGQSITQAPDGDLSFADLSEGEKLAQLAGLPWDGLEPDEAELAMSNAADGVDLAEGIEVEVTVEEQRAAFREWRDDDHAARVRDYGPEDAATYEGRVAEGAGMLGVGPDGSPLERVERQLRDWKADNPPDYASDAMTEADKLHILEADIDWAGVDGRDKQSVLAREVDFGKITRDELNDVYEEIGSDEIDERPARRLFDDANFERARLNTGDFEAQLAEVRDTTRNLIESVMLDSYPRAGAAVDFGLDSREHYEALYYPIRNEEIMPSVLDAALGHGEKLTELARDAPSNPHKDVQFHTSWDELLGRQPAGSDYERTLRDAAEQAQHRTRERDNGPER